MKVSKNDGKGSKSSKSAKAKPDKTSSKQENKRIKMTEDHKVLVFSKIRDNYKALFGNMSGNIDLTTRRKHWNEVLGYCNGLGYKYKEFDSVKDSFLRAKRCVTEAWRNSMKTGKGGDSAFLKKLKRSEKVVYNACKDDMEHMKKLKVSRLKDYTETVY